MAFRVRGNVVLTVHATEPSDEEWLLSIGVVTSIQAASEEAAILGVCLAPNAIPSTRQRTLVSAHVDQQRLRIALVGGGRAMRAVVKAFSLFYPQTRVFALEEVDAAIRFISSADFALHRRDLEELARHFGSNLQTQQ